MLIYRMIANCTYIMWLQNLYFERKKSSSTNANSPEKRENYVLNQNWN